MLKKKTHVLFLFEGSSCPAIPELPANFQIISSGADSPFGVEKLPVIARAFNLKWWVERALRSDFGLLILDMW